MRDYLIFLACLAVCAIFSAWASAKVHSTYAAFSEENARSNMTGYDTAVRLLRANGIYDVQVGRVRGKLSDHFNPKKRIVNLSQTTYGDNSVAAVAVAAHEIGCSSNPVYGFLILSIIQNYSAALRRSAFSAI